eukprot:TRINITY_DN1618_c0_g1_i2.p1 TRINITY_DN1618_c0_g1~~TRINITY_DN1618_c0_g1_i2.p1  ORF type:complete len:148 (-),score=24.88 TRINITY_DN1618_c0_g1_i2:36-479(-)
MPPEHIPQFEIFWNKKTHTMRGFAEFDETNEGPPGCVHGGASAAILDEVLGLAVWMHVQQPSVTANLNINYRNFTPLKGPRLLESKVNHHDGRKIYAEGRTMNVEGNQTHVEATGLWLTVQESKRSKVFEDIFGRNSPINSEKDSSK